MSVVLLKGPESGHALVRWDDDVQLRDLYSPNPVSTTLRFTGVRRWFGRLYRDVPEHPWLQLRQGIREGRLMRLTIGGHVPREWSGDALASLLRDARIKRESTANGVTFQVEHPEIAVRLPQPWYRSSRSERLPRYLLLWAMSTAVLAVIMARIGSYIPPLGRLLRFKVVKFAVLVGINLAAAVILAWGFERYLRWRDPFLRELPFDSGRQTLDVPYYRYLDVPARADVFPWGGKGWYTWGHFATSNTLGFRDREWDTPKPGDTCRIMVLGDSFTWGAGVAVEQRYTDVAEASLRRMFTGRTIEIASVASSSLTTCDERDLLDKHGRALAPDLIVVGFVNNDTQPLGYMTGQEQRFWSRHGPRIDALSEGLLRVGLPQTARLTKEAISNALVAGGVIPHWEVGLGETYDERSKEWKAFDQALRDIKRMSDDMRLPAPYFSVLNHTIDSDHPTRYDDSDAGLPRHLQWYHQAERLAARIGYRTYNHERELVTELRPEELAVNALDPHPSARVHALYAAKLTQALAEELAAGRLCGEETPR